MLEFLKELFTDNSVIGSIIGGLLGGLFTYLAVILTFKNEQKNSYPEKLGILADLLSEVEAVQSQLSSYFEKVEEDQFAFVIRDLDTRKHDRSFLKKAVLVDRKTYKAVAQGKGYRYPDTITLSKSKEDLNNADRYRACLHVLNRNIESRINYYTRKL